MAVALRFIIFAIPGLILYLICILALIVEIEEKGFTNINPILSGFLALLGILSMLYGAGKWKQWRYIWIFISIPLSILLCEISNIEIFDPKLDIGLVVLLAASLTSCVVRRSYKKDV